jgi:hypothetical protein
MDSISEEYSVDQAATGSAQSEPALPVLFLVIFASVFGGSWPESLPPGTATSRPVTA